MKKIHTVTTRALYPLSLRGHIVPEAISSAGLLPQPRGFLLMTVLFYLVLVVSLESASFAEEIPQRLDGKVISMDHTSRILLIDFEHPATGEHTEKKFFVAEDAGFKDFKKLSQLKQGDLISIDYYDYQPIPKVIYMIHIPIEKTYFTHKEIAQALGQIKSNRKDTNASEV